jgi:hypothetical protein
MECLITDILFFIPFFPQGGVFMAAIQTSQELARLEPFGLYFRQRPAPLPVSVKGQTTSEPEITTGDGNDPDKIDSIWIPDEDEIPDDDPPKKLAQDHSAIPW